MSGFLYGFVGASDVWHIVSAEHPDRTLCHRPVGSTPDLQPADPNTLCGMCNTLSVTTPGVRPYRRTGCCSTCGGDVDLDRAGRALSHGVARMSKGRIVRTDEPCSGAGKPAEDLPQLAAARGGRR